MPATYLWHLISTVAPAKAGAKSSPFNMPIGFQPALE
jgi:hypothetical protein